MVSGEKPTDPRDLDPIPDEEHQWWLCPLCRTRLDILAYRSWADGSPGAALFCPACQWVESEHWPTDRDLPPLPGKFPPRPHR